MERLKILDRLATFHGHCSDLEVEMIKITKKFPVMEPALRECIKLSQMVEKTLADMGLFLEDEKSK